MLKAYKYKIYPTKSQIELIEKHFGATRFVYNYFLDFRQREYAKENNKVRYITTQSELTKLKHLDEYSWLNELNSQALQMALRNLDNAFTKFFKKEAGYPKYKSKKNSHQSFTAPQNIKIANNRLYVPKFKKKEIKLKYHRPIPKDAIIKQATISRQNNQYFVSITFEDNIPIPKPIKAKNAVGLDMGIESFIVRSDAIAYPNTNKRYFIRSQRRLKILQRKLSKKQKGSKNRLKAKLKVQKLHTKITNQRRDYLHKISSEITN